ncbi:ankyrin [Alternaria alternata]|uniref:Ankyrin n=2 Tax=Alternaria sect. Alternaria TaxID=2499237 RepID=A0A177DB83_ALTAL|nr:ankyrin [Alternaria alternata]OAG17043.1 ankyrin [Alternaria alternata]
MHGDNAADGTTKSRENPSSLSCPPTVDRSPVYSVPLYVYMHEFISNNSDRIFQDIDRLKSQHQVHEHQQTTDYVLSQPIDIHVEAIVRYKIPSRRFHQIMRGTRDDLDLDLLRRILIATDPDEDWKSFGETLLFNAVKDRNLSLLDVLLNAGVNEMALQEAETVNYQFDEYPFNVLQVAVQYEYDDAIRTLTSHGAIIFTGCPYTDCAFLANAIEHAMHLVRPLLAECIRLLDHQISQKGSAALSRAVILSNDKVVDVLLQTGFSPYTGRYNGPFSNKILPYGSPFELAMFAWKSTYLKRFLKFPWYDTSKKQYLERQRQLTAAYISAWSSRDLELEKAILEAGLKPNEMRQIMGDDHMQQWLYFGLAKAIEYGDLRLFQLAVTRENVSMIKAGAEVNAPPGILGKTAIEIAAEVGSLEMVTFLLKTGADFEGQHNRNYRRAIYRARNNGHMSVVGLLHEWKRSKYGRHDCDTLDNLRNSITPDELDFQSEAARAAHLKDQAEVHPAVELSGDKGSVASNG